MDKDIYLKYLNTAQKEKVKEYAYINESNFSNIKTNDFVKYIKKKNLQFREGGVVSQIIKNTLIVRNIRYNYKYAININDHIILHRPRRRRNSKREFMEYLLKGLDNNTIKITKKTN